MAKAYSDDLRCKLLTAYDRGQGSLRELAEVFSVSYDWAKKISRQRLRSQQMAAGLAAQFCPANHPLDSRYLTFAGGKQLDCHNQATAATAPINPVALSILQLKTASGAWLVPVPQTLLTTGSNAGLGFSSYSLPSHYYENQYLINGDYLATPKNTIAARVYLATIDQYRTFGSPQGYPGTPMVPGQGTPQALGAHDYVASLNLTSSFNKTLVNDARMSFTRS